MKVAQLGTGVKTVLKPTPFSGDMKDKMDGKSINQCLVEGIIDEIGDENGRFIFNHDKTDDLYAQFGRKACKVSDAVAAIVADATDDDFGELVFYKSVSGKSYLNGVETPESEGGVFTPTFTLGLPRGYNFNESVKSISVGVSAEKS